MALTGVLAFELLPSLTAAGRAARWQAWTTPALVWQPLTFFACVGVIFVSVNLAMLTLLMLPYAGNFIVSFR